MPVPIHPVKWFINHQFDLREHKHYNHLPDWYYQCSCFSLCFPLCRLFKIKSANRNFPTGTHEHTKTHQYFYMKDKRELSNKLQPLSGIFTQQNEITESGRCRMKIPTENRLHLTHYCFFFSTFLLLLFAARHGALTPKHTARTHTVTPRHFVIFFGAEWKGKGGRYMKEESRLVPLHLIHHMFVLSLSSFFSSIFSQLYYFIDWWCGENHHWKMWFRGKTEFWKVNEE